MIFDIHRNMLKGQEENGSQHRSVSITRTPPVTKYTLMVSRPRIGQHPQLPRDPVSYVCI